MATYTELEQQLSREALDLYARVTEARDAEVDPNSVQKLMDSFLVQWSALLTEERETQIQDAHVEAEQKHPEIVYGQTVFTEKDRAERVLADFREAEAQIRAQIDDLRSNMIDAVRDVDRGRVPEVILEPAYTVVQPVVADRKLDASQEPESWADIVARKRQEAGMEPAVSRDEPTQDIEHER